MGNLINFGFNFLAKVAVDNSTFWAMGIQIFLKIADLYLGWYKSDIEMKKNYVAFVEKMASKGLVSLSLRQSAQDQYKKLLEAEYGPKPEGK